MTSHPCAIFSELLKKNLRHEVDGKMWGKGFWEEEGEGRVDMVRLDCIRYKMSQRIK